jgi:hypothetical protein
MSELAHHTQSVRTTYNWLLEGRYAVPKLQRAFVWNGPKAALLLDSIYRNLPIGTITIWDTSRRNKNLLRHTNGILPAFDDSNSRVLFVLDGQQRLSVLYHVLTGGTNLTAQHREVDFGHVVFRITEGSDEPRLAYRRPVPGKWVPVPELLTSGWRRKLRNISDGQMRRAASFRQAIFTYKISFVQMVSNKLDEARELFIRINSLGTPLSAADRAFARASQFDLRELAEDTWQRLPAGFRGITNETLLQTLALIENNGEVGERAFQEVTRRWDRRIRSGKSEVKEFTRLWDRHRIAVLKAIDCLRLNFNVIDDGLLPSQYMLATLAVFFFHSGSQPTQHQLTEIRKWFWATGVAQRYSGMGFRSNILADGKFFRRLAGSGGRFGSFERADNSDLKKTQYGLRTSIGDSFSCLLIAQKPMYFSNGQPMQVTDYASPTNRKHRHHVFPRALLRQLGVSTNSTNSILNLCFISASENSIAGSKRPSAYLKPFMGKRNFARVMKSHLIPLKNGSGIYNSNVKVGYRQFIQQRTRLIVKEFEHQAGIKLFRNEYA